MGECESHSQLMSKFVILNKVSNCRRHEGSEGGWDGRTDGRTDSYDCKFHQYKCRVVICSSTKAKCGVYFCYDCQLYQVTISAMTYTV